MVKMQVGVESRVSGIAEPITNCNSGSIYYFAWQNARYV